MSCVKTASTMPCTCPPCGATFSSRRNLCKVRARAVVIHVAVFMFVLVCLSSCKLVASKCMCLWPCRSGPHGPWEGCAAHRVATAFRCGAPDQASIAAPTDSWRPLVVKLLAHDRAEPLHEGAPLDAALQAWENTTSTTGVHADRLPLIRVCIWRWFAMRTVPGWQAVSVLRRGLLQLALLPDL